MKNTMILLVCLFVASFVLAEVNFKALENAHKIMQKAKGSMLEEAGTYMMGNSNGRVCSLWVGNTKATGYMEMDARKIYWEIVKIEGGIKLIIHVNILGKEYTKEFIIKFGDTEVAVTAVEDGSRVNYICLVACVGQIAFKCWPQCGTNLSCWIGCAGGDAGCILGCF